MNRRENNWWTERNMGLESLKSSIATYLDNAIRNMSFLPAANAYPIVRLQVDRKKDVHRPLSRRMTLFPADKSFFALSSTFGNSLQKALLVEGEDVLVFSTYSQDIPFNNLNWLESGDPLKGNIVKGLRINALPIQRIETFLTCTQSVRYKKRLTEEFEERFDGVYGRISPSYSVVKEWAKRFRMDQEFLEDDEIPGRPVEMTIHKVPVVEELILSDRRLKLIKFGKLQSFCSNRVENARHPGIQARYPVADRNLMVHSKVWRQNFAFCSGIRRVLYLSCFRDSAVPHAHVLALVRGTALLPCDLTPSLKNDSILLVVWYKDDHTPIYRN
nr:unnamed protein product [Callosobruchus analis]